jgi:hypothetical protein
MVAGYWMMSWAVERYVHTQRLHQDPMLIPFYRSEYLNSKAGRAEFGDEEE